MMRAAAATLKREIEAQLAERVPSALSPLVRSVRLHETGNEHLDRLLDGGLPLGSVCEVTGPDGSGRTSLAHALLAVASAETACAYLDPSDTFSPPSAASAGVRLPNLLWVRFRSGDPAKNIANPRAVDAAVPQEHEKTIHTGWGTCHPRGETKGLAPALEEMLFYKDERRKRKMEGTPGHPNQPLGLHTASKEQVDWERFNLRRVDETDPLRQMDKLAAEAARVRSAVPVATLPVRTKQAQSWNRLDSVLRAADQVLQSGGFRVVVLDLASLPVEQVLRIPSATWFRFRRAAQESDAILLLLTQEACARSSAACVLSCGVAEDPVFQGVFQSASRGVEVARQRTGPAFAKKMPGRVACWDALPPTARLAGR